MDEELDKLQLIVEIFDEDGNYEGEWTYDVSRGSIIQWEEVDMQDGAQGKTLVRCLLLTKLKEHSPSIWDLLTNNSSVVEFLAEGVPSGLVAEIPRLSIINTAVDRIYECLSKLVLQQQIRIAH